jgi:hypothetical protein
MISVLDHSFWENIDLDQGTGTRARPLNRMASSLPKFGSKI